MLLIESYQRMLQSINALNIEVDRNRHMINGLIIDKQASQLEIDALKIKQDSLTIVLNKYIGNSESSIHTHNIREDELRDKISQEIIDITDKIDRMYIQITNYENRINMLKNTNNLKLNNIRQLYKQSSKIT